MKLKVYVYGAGKNLESFFEGFQFMNQINILGILDKDSSKWGWYRDIEIQDPRVLNDSIFDAIIVTPYAFQEIKNELINSYHIAENLIVRSEDIMVPELCNLGTIQINDRDKSDICVIRDKFEHAELSNDMEKFFVEKKHRLMNKWLHYFEIYETFLSKYRNVPIKMLEIGVYKGGSMQMWQDYFLNDSEIIGIDIDPSCKRYEQGNVHICIGSQDDPEFLNDVIEKYGPFAIVLDDGSHLMKHQIASFEVLFEAVNDGGVYICEDCHTSYWPEYDGMLNGKDTFIEYSKQFIDSVNSQHVDKNYRKFLHKYSEDIKAVHYYDSIVVIEKSRRGYSKVLEIEND